MSIGSLGNDTGDMLVLLLIDEKNSIVNILPLTVEILKWVSKNKTAEVWVCITNFNCSLHDSARKVLYCYFEYEYCILASQIMNIECY